MDSFHGTWMDKPSQITNFSTNMKSCQAVNDQCPMDAANLVRKYNQARLKVIFYGRTVNEVIEDHLRDDPYRLDITSPDVILLADKIDVNKLTKRQKELYLTGNIFPQPLKRDQYFEIFTDSSQELLIYYVPGELESISIREIDKLITLPSDIRYAATNPSNVRRTLETYGEEFAVSTNNTEILDAVRNRREEAINFAILMCNHFDKFNRELEDRDTSMLEIVHVVSKRTSKFWIRDIWDLFPVINKPLIGIQNGEVYVTVSPLFRRGKKHEKDFIVEIHTLEDNFVRMLTFIEDLSIVLPQFRIYSEQATCMIDIITKLLEKRELRKRIEVVKRELHAFRKTLSSNQIEMLNCKNFGNPNLAVQARLEAGSETTELQGLGVFNIELDSEEIAGSVYNAVQGLGDKLCDKVDTTVEDMKTYTSTNISKVVKNLLAEVAGETNFENVKTKLDNFVDSGKIHCMLSLIGGITALDELLSTVFENVTCIPQCAFMASIYYVVRNRGKAAAFTGAVFISVVMTNTILQYSDNSAIGHTIPILGLGVYLLYRLYNNENYSGNVELQSSESERFDTFFTRLFEMFNGLSKSFNNFVRLCKNIESMTELAGRFKSWMIKLYNMTLAKVFGWDKIEDFDGFLETQKVFIKDSEELLDSFKEKTLNFTMTSFKRITKLIESGTELYNMMKSTKERPQHIRTFYDLLNRLKNVREYMQQTRLMDCTQKIEPVSIQFVGHPGKFKTVLTNATVAACVAIAGTPEQVEQYSRNISAGIYNRMTDLQFWDNYSESDVLVTIIDDIFQAADTEGGQTSEALDVIHIVNSHPFMLNQAHLHNKGSTMFNSKFFITTTNRFDLSLGIKSIIEPAAMARRFHLRILPVPKDEYCLNTNCDLRERAFDMSKVPIVDGFGGQPMTDINHTLFDFYLLDIRGNLAQPTDKLSFADIISKIKNLYDQKINQLYRNNECIGSIAVKIREFISKNPGRDLSDLADEISPKQMELTKELVAKRFLNALDSLASEVPSDHALLFKSSIRKYELDIRLISKVDFFRCLHAYQIPNPCSYCHQCGRTGLLVKQCTVHESEEDNESTGSGITMESIFEYDDFKEVELQSGTSIDFKFSQICFNNQDSNVWDNIMLDLKNFIKMIPKDPAYEKPLLDYLDILCLCYDELMRRPLYEERKDIPKLLRGFSLFYHSKDTFLRYFDCDNTLGFEPMYIEKEIIEPREIKLPERLIGNLQDVLQGFKDRSFKILNGIYKHPSFSKIMLGGTALAIVTTVVGVMSRYLGKVEPDTSTQHTPVEKLISQEELQNYHKTFKMIKPIKSKSNYKYKSSRQPGPARDVATHGNLQAGSVSDSELLKSITDRNAGYIVLRCNKYEKIIGYCLFIDSETIMFPLHFLHEIYREHTDNLNYDLYIVNMQRQVEAVISSDRIEKWLDNDTWDLDEGLIDGHIVLATIVFKQEKRSIIKRFMKEEDLKILPHVFDIQIDFPLQNAIFKSNAVITGLVVEGFDIPRTVEYLCTSTKGCCGAPLAICNDMPDGRIIMGLHYAGLPSSRRGYSGIVTQEAIMRAKAARLRQPSLQGTIPLGLPSTCMHFDKFQILAQVQNKHKHNVYASKPSDIVPSPYYNYGNGQATKRVALLNIKNGVDPYANAMKHFPTEDLNYDTEALGKAVLDLRDMYFSLGFPSHRIRVLTVEEALWGNDGLDSWSSIASSTSSGYPMKFNSSHVRLKDRLLPKESHDPEALEELKEEIAFLIEDYNECNRWLWIFTDNLKNELVKHKKYIEGNTRLFCGAPFVYLVVFRMYFGAFAQFILENRITNESAVGCNPYSDEWNLIARKLLKFSPYYDKGNVMAGDYKKFDISQRSFILWIIFEIIQEWYDDDNRNIRETLWREVTNSRHIFQDIIYEWYCSLPSGHPFTIFINNMYNQLAMRYAYYRIFKYITDSFNKNVSLVVTGDDNAMSCSPLIAEDFNMVRIAEAVAELGLTITLDDKEADLNAVRDITEITFLKRSFIYDRRLTRWVGALSLETILEGPRWTRENMRKSDIVAAHIREYFAELSIHTREVFNEYAKVLIKALRRKPLLGYEWDFSYEKNRFRILTPEEDSYTNPHFVDYSYYAALAPYLDLNPVDTEYRETVGDASDAIEVEREDKLDSVTVKSPSLAAHSSSRGGLVSTRQEVRSSDTRPESPVCRDQGLAQNTKNEFFPVSLQSSGRLDMDSVNAEITSESLMGATHMYNDAIVINESATDGLTEALTETATGGLDVGEDIKKFLARPRKFKSGLFQATDIVSTFNADGFFVPFDVIDNVQLGNKLKGYHGFRATTVLTWVVNANPFQQGRYMLCAIPTGGAQGSSTQAIEWVNMHIATKTMRTQLPRVEIDITCDTTAVLRLPYSGVQDYYPLTAANDITRYGTQYVIRMFPYSVLEYGTGSANATWSLWVHFEDVELIAAAAPAVGLQAGGDTTKIEQDSQNAGPIESTALKVSKAAKFLTPVPFVGQYATGLSWVADIVGNVAKVFGWSNPTNLEHEHRMIRSQTHYANNVDKMEAQSLLALTTTNKIALRPSLRDNKEDQLDYANFAGRFAWTDTLDWTTAMAEGTELANEDVTLAFSVQSATLSNGWTYEVMIPAAWLVKNHRFWRSSIVYKFKIVKTQFHSGRLAIAFTPNTGFTTSTDVTYANSDYAYREIIDIREMNEYTFAIPYISHAPYKTSVYDTPADTSLGKLKVFVVDPLRAPSTVSSGVRILVEMAAGPDFEVQTPRFGYTLPATGVTLQAGPCEEPPKSIGSSIQTKYQLMTSADCFGERVSNLRQLVKRSHAISAPHAQDELVAYKYHIVAPFVFAAFKLSESTGANIHPWQVNDLYGALMSIFTYSTGGANIKLYQTIEPNTQSYPSISYIMPLVATDGTAISQGIYYQSDTTPDGLVRPSRGTVNNASRYQYGKSASGKQNFIEYNCPGYHIFRRHTNLSGMLTKNSQDISGSKSVTVELLANPVYKRNVVVTMLDGGSYTANDAGKWGEPGTYRSGAEDTDFFDFVSVPAFFQNINSNY